MKMRHFLILFTIGIGFTTFLSAQDLHFQGKTLPCLKKSLPIVVHLIHTEEQEPVLNEADALLLTDAVNKYFEPICLEFDVCEVREIENFQFVSIDSLAEWEELQITYHVENKINVYFVENFDHVDDICGTATIDGIFENESGGIVIQADCANPSSAVLAHQLGHYLGLQNTFENGNELVARQECEITGDSLCDTPADNYEIPNSITQYIRTSVTTIDTQELCRFINNMQDAQGMYYCPDVGNIMSNYAVNPPSPANGGFLECRCGFSADQYRLMAENCLEAKNIGD